MQAIIVTSTDDKYAPLANDLFLSLAQHQYNQPFSLGLLDVGLNEVNRNHFQALGVTVQAVASDIDYPARAKWESARPGIRTLTARPFLRRYFPGYDVYIWLDADTWVQTPEVINTLLAAVSNSPALAIAVELDRCYQSFFKDSADWQKFTGWYETCYDRATAASMSLKPMLNAGVFALNKTSPFWEAWAAIYTEALQRVSEINERSFMADQLGLNILCYLRGLPYLLLPAICNWLTCYAVPKLDRASGLYVETMPPYRPISLLHLTRPNKLQVERIECHDGGVVERPLTFFASQPR